MCEQDPYLLELTRYIHLNPLRAGVVKDMDELDIYPWTGHSVVMGAQSHSWQDRGAILAYFGKTEGAARRSYRRFVEGGIAMGKRTDLIGGGLIRSAGGWSKVISMRRRCKPTTSDARILGSGTFVGTVLAKSDQKKGDAVRWKTITDLSVLANIIAKNEGIDISDLLSGSRKPQLVRARRLLSQIAVKMFKYTGATVARYLGVTTSLVNRMVHQKEVTDLTSYLDSSL